MAKRNFLQSTGRSLKHFLAALVLVSVFSWTHSVTLQAQDLDVPYVPTPQSVVEGMLDLALVDSSDYVIDLGSGDGRIVITAAERGAAGHGIDLDPDRIQEARRNASEAGVEDRVIFMQEDLFDTDFSRASVITMYLLSSVNIKLRPKLLEELKPGTRVVSHSFDMDEWTADVAQTIEEDDGGTSRIYLWVIPAQLEGEWGWTQNGSDFSMDVAQEFQNVDLDISEENQTLQVKNAHLKGPRVTFTAQNGRKQYLYSGHIENDQITGNVQIRQGNDSWIEKWTASKN